MFLFLSNNSYSPIFAVCSYYFGIIGVDDEEMFWEFEVGRLNSSELELFFFFINIFLFSDIDMPIFVF